VVIFRPGIVIKKKGVYWALFRFSQVSRVKE
jgi:hypothetical protein